MRRVFGTVAAVLALLGAWILAAHLGGDGIFVIANGALLAVRKKELRRILGDANKIEKKYEGKAAGEWTPEDRTAYKALLDEGETVQGDLDDLERKAKLEGRAGTGEITEPPDDTKGKPDARGVVGYVSLGELSVMSKAFQAYAADGFPAGFMGQLVAADPILRKGAGKVYAGLDRKGLEVYNAVRGALETKAVATIGAGVLEPQRIAEVVRATEHAQLRLRDVLNVSPTGAASIQYVRITSVTRAADTVAESADKPEATLVLAVVTTPVDTHAVWMPVTEQQLQDLPQLANMIDVELTYDLDKLEEELCIWGVGTTEFLGVMNAGITACRVVSGDTLIDKIRRMMTDIRRAGYIPNGVLIDPLDWETVVLEKGTDAHYLRQVFPTTDGDYRVWGINVVESVAAQNDATGERDVIVGDWVRGATLWDRMQNTVAVGWINDQFIKNQRTIRVENRSGFGVKRTAAFRYARTNDPGS